MNLNDPERLAALPPDQQQALIAQLTERIIASWDKQWGALPMGEEIPLPPAVEASE